MNQIEKRVWGYCRCGGADQTDIEKQAEQLKKYAESRGYIFLGFTVGHGSGLEPDSLEMAEIERAASEQAAYTLIIRDISRLSRKVDQALGSLEYIAQIPMNVEYVNGADLSADGLFKDIINALPEYISSVESGYGAEHEEDCEFGLNDDSEEPGR